MLAPQILVAGLIAVASAGFMHVEDLEFASILKRQEPGSASYNCHDNCGTAITLSRQPHTCHNNAFVTNYNNCLQCAGPDNFNIWRMYGRTLGTAGSACGFETEPKAGKQEDVGPAVHVSSSAAGASPSVASATPAPASVSEGPASVTPVSTITPPAASSTVPVLPSSSANGTINVTSPIPPQQTANAAAGLDFANAGVFGAIFVGALFGL